MVDVTNKDISKKKNSF